MLELQVTELKQKVDKLTEENLKLKQIELPITDATSETLEIVTKHGADIRSKAEQIRDEVVELLKSCSKIIGDFGVKLCNTVYDMTGK